MRTRTLAGAGVTGLALSLLATAPAQADDRSRHGQGSQDLRVTTTKDTADHDLGDGECADAWGQCSLRAAVQQADASGGGTVVLAKKATYALTLHGEDDTGAAGDLDVSSAVTIEGNGATVDARGEHRVFDVLAGGWLKLNHLTVTGGAALGEGLPASGGGVRNAGVLEVERSTITGNTATRAGGGIEASPGSTTTINRSTLSHNSTGAGPGNGGGLHLTGAGTVHVTRSVVSGNTAAAEGGGLWNSGAGTMTVERTKVVGNTASGDDATMGGGGLFQDAGSGTLTVTRSEIRHNVADGAAGSGGGILNDQGTVVVERSIISGNSSQRAGGGIEANVGTTKLSRTELNDNTTGAVPGNGGGLHLTGAGTVTIERSRVTGNAAANEGGGLWNSATGTMTVTRTDIRRNYAPVGPNVYQDGAGTGFTIDGETVAPTDGS
ncbi:right-handed parallel beta-helix repeat-containing protein [Blastococcus sp. BMG 814]|uniref:Right-handed parallel beta-helix repeat-containing protein n=1 Tax=Blastococcus carthaginiensis TaxID=3050034 RepID=A0ABT9ICY8_9ACTN|nr:right-handed parallel beta-helix repeat-containing protein [Blastococcus carthaginiensis]MDP5183437.1 right-handed parallel beta-helix repeat-containing protein [Blastococcus carthaginiensis]